MFCKVNKSNILMTARTFRHGGFCLALWPISGYRTIDI